MKAIVLFFAAAAAGGTWQEEILAAQNAIRAKVGVAPLQWSDKLGAVAQAWADDLLQRKAFAHKKKNPYGENLFESFGETPTPRDVVSKWGSEEANFNYKTNKCSGTCGHYTQLVWRDTKRVGCAVARGGGREVWVCEYDPPGNYVGQRPY